MFYTVLTSSGVGAATLIYLYHNSVNKQKELLKQQIEYRKDEVKELKDTYCPGRDCKIIELNEFKSLVNESTNKNITLLDEEKEQLFKFMDRNIIVSNLNTQQCDTQFPIEIAKFFHVYDHYHTYHKSHLYQIPNWRSIMGCDEATISEDYKLCPFCGRRHIDPNSCFYDVDNRLVEKNLYGDEIPPSGSIFQLLTIPSDGIWNKLYSYESKKY